MEYKKFTPEQLDRAKNADIIVFWVHIWDWNLKHRENTINAVSITVLSSIPTEKDLFGTAEIFQAVIQ